MKYGEYALFVLCTLGFLAYIVWISIYASRHEDMDVPVVWVTLSIVFFAIFVLIAVVNIALLIQINKSNKEVRNISDRAFKRERRTLITILFFFEVSYLVRFTVDMLFR